MDWARAKTILILLFLLLNLFLVSSIVFSRSNNSMKPDYVYAAEQILTARNITVQVPIPEYQDASGWIVYEEEWLDTGALALQLLGKNVYDEVVVNATAKGQFSDVSNQFTKAFAYQQNGILFTLSDAGAFVFEGPGIQHFSGTNAQDLDRQLRSWFETAGMKDIPLRLESTHAIENGFYMAYIQTHRGFSLFQNRLLVRIQNGQLTMMQGSLKKVKKENVKKNILSVQQLLIMSVLPENAVVSDIQFGWLATDEGELYDNPVWRLTLLNTQERYYLATTGELIFSEPLSGE